MPTKPLSPPRALSLTPPAALSAGRVAAGSDAGETAAEVRMHSSARRRSAALGRFLAVAGCGSRNRPAAGDGIATVASRSTPRSRPEVPELRDSLRHAWHTCAVMLFACDAVVLMLGGLVRLLACSALSRTLGRGRPCACASLVRVRHGTEVKQHAVSCATAWRGLSRAAAVVVTCRSLMRSILFSLALPASIGCGVRSWRGARAARRTRFKV